MTSFWHQSVTVTMWCISFIALGLSINRHLMKSSPSILCHKSPTFVRIKPPPLVILGRHFALFYLVVTPWPLLHGKLLGKFIVSSIGNSSQRIISLYTGIYCSSMIPTHCQNIIIWKSFVAFTVKSSGGTSQLNGYYDFSRETLNDDHMRVLMGEIKDCFAIHSSSHYNECDTCYHL